MSNVTQRSVSHFHSLQVTESLSAECSGSRNSSLWILVYVS